MMKKKKILGKIISLLLVCSMLLSITGTNTKVLASENTATETQTSNLPWADYKRITMADYGAVIATSDEGTTFSASQSWTYKGESLDGTFLDVDVKFNGGFLNRYIQFFGGDWNNWVRIQGDDNSDKDSVEDDTISIHGGSKFTHIRPLAKDMGIYADEFFNLKILMDIKVNAMDSTQQDVQIQVYVNDEHQLTRSWTESIYTEAQKEQNYKTFYFYSASGNTFSLRTPEAWTCYERITMDNFGIKASTDEAGTVYSSPQPGTYSGDLHGKYLDVDIKFDESYDSYFIFYDGTDWYDTIKIAMCSSSFNVTCDGGNFTNKWSAATACGISANQFFNLKILFDIADNGNSEQTVQIQVYIDNNHYHTAEWTESIEQSFNSISFQTNTVNDVKSSYALRTPTPEPQSYFKLSDYREMTPYTYPTRSGYVFAGWYTDAQYTTPVESDVTIGQAYAKFVKSDVLTVKCQLPIDANRTEPTTSLRLVTSVDTLNYQYVGFELEYTLEDKTYEKTFKTKNVKKTIKATGDDGKEITYYPNEFSTASTYMMALKINKIPSEIYELPLTITPYWITLDGTVVTGTTRNDVVLYPEIMEGGSTFANDNEAYYKSAWN